MFRIFLVIIFSITFVSPAFAWGQTGHRITGEIAEPYLSDNARAQIQKILGDESMAEVSNWPDYMRSSDEHFWQKQAGAFHYVTVPPGKTYSEVGAPKRGDAFTALQRFKKVLQDPTASADEKALALRFIIHLIGDLHQPLHVGNGKDRGGNQFSVVFFDKPTNLHRVWDAGIIDHEQLSFLEKTKWLSQKITPQDVANWWHPDPLVWIAESATLRDTIYPEQQILSWGYVFDHISNVDLRLSQAGVRIAAYLNDVFDQTDQD